MTVHLWDRRLTWLAVPKVACTSIKHAFFQVENGRGFLDFTANGQYFHIHRIYPTRNFVDLPQARIADHLRLAVVRDPVRRLLSCYGDRVIYNRVLSARAAGPALAAAGLPTNPGLELFIDRLEDYHRAVPDLTHHAAPHTRFLGHDPSYFSDIFSMRQLPDMAARLTALLGQTVEIAHFQTHGPKFDPAILPGPSLAAIRRFYAEDYDLWGRYF
jgi:Sulfotransferase family